MILDGAVDKTSFTITVIIGCHGHGCSYTPSCDLFTGLIAQWVFFWVILFHPLCVCIYVHVCVFVGRCVWVRVRVYAKERERVCVFVRKCKDSMRERVCVCV